MPPSLPTTKISMLSRSPRATGLTTERSGTVAPATTGAHPDHAPFQRFVRTGPWPLPSASLPATKISMLPGSREQTVTAERIGTVSPAVRFPTTFQPSHDPVHRLV